MELTDLEKAREWAESRANGNYALSEETRAAVKVIQSLPDQWIDADKLRDVIADWGDREVSADVHALYQQVLALVPALPPRTLADMSLDELKVHIRGEVMVDGWANPTMLISVIDDEGAVLARRLNKQWPFVEVHPLSAITPVATPKQEAESTPEPVQPRPEDVPPGELWSILYYGKEWAGVRSDSEWVPWSIISMDGQDYRDVDDSEIALMFRLVPESKENA